MDLVTVAEVKEFLQKESTDVAQDPLLATLVTQASALARTYTGREFEDETTATRTFEWDGGELLDLVPYDARAVSAVVVGTDTDYPTTLDVGDWALRPKPSRYGVYPLLRLYQAPRPPRSRGECEVEVTGDWGWPTGGIPEEVPLAIKVAVSLWIKRDAAAFAATFNPDEGRALIPDYLPAAAKGIIRPLKRQVAGA